MKFAVSIGSSFHEQHFFCSLRAQVHREGLGQGDPHQDPCGQSCFLTDQHLKCHDPLFTALGASPGIFPGSEPFFLPTRGLQGQPFHDDLEHLYHG